MSKTNKNNKVNKANTVDKTDSKKVEAVTEPVKEVKKETSFSGVVINGRLNVRADKTVKSEILKVLEPGSKVVINRKEGGWGKLKNEAGWVMLKWISF